MSDNTCAKVHIEISDNATWEDAFQFGDASDTTWDLTGQNFRIDIKTSKEATSTALSLTSGAGTIVVDDVTQRVIHVLVDDATIQASLVPAEYVYDLIMYDNAVPPVRVRLMRGTLKVYHGITGD